MSIARLHTVNSARKHQGKCERCGVELPPGQPYRWFTVGFRSRYKHRRCMKSECTPRISERESSRLAEIYAAQEDATATIEGATDVDDIKSALEDLGSAARELAEEYRTAAVNPNTGATFNYEAEQRGDDLESYADELESWEPDSEQPDEGEDEDGEWLENTRQEAIDHLNSVASF